jgi:hypothetical protein
MTLFASVASGESVFEQALQKYFGGEPDHLTLDILDKMRKKSTVKKKMAEKETTTKTPKMAKRKSPKKLIAGKSAKRKTGARNRTLSP